MTERVLVLPAPAADYYDVFRVLSYTEGTPLEGRVEVDSVYVPPYSRSSNHYHEGCDTLLIPLSGGAIALIDEREFLVKPGNMFWFDRAVTHEIRTMASSLAFLSIQVPGIKIRQPDGTVRVDLVPAK